MASDREHVRDHDQSAGATPVLDRDRATEMELGQ
jgi:hypothetical protein